jgi:hypothetical protein
MAQRSLSELNADWRRSSADDLLRSAGRIAEKTLAQSGVDCFFWDMEGECPPEVFAAARVRESIQDVDGYSGEGDLEKRDLSVCIALMNLIEMEKALARKKSTSRNRGLNGGAYSAYGGKPENREAAMREWSRLRGVILKEHPAGMKKDRLYAEIVKRAKDGGVTWAKAVTCHKTIRTALKEWDSRRVSRKVAATVGN